MREKRKKVSMDFRSTKKKPKKVGVEFGSELTFSRLRLTFFGSGGSGRNLEVRLGHLHLIEATSDPRLVDFSPRFLYIMVQELLATRATPASVILRGAVRPEESKHYRCVLKLGCLDSSGRTAPLRMTKPRCSVPLLRHYTDTEMYISPTETYESADYLQVATAKCIFRLPICMFSSSKYRSLRLSLKRVSEEVVGME